MFNSFVNGVPRYLNFSTLSEDKFPITIILFKNIHMAKFFWKQFTFQNLLTYHVLKSDCDLLITPFVVKYSLRINHHHHNECSAQRQVSHCKLRHQGRSSTANSRNQGCSLTMGEYVRTFPLLSASHFLFSVWIHLKRSEKIPGAPAWRGGEWIWLTGPPGLHRNSPHDLNISSIGFLTRSQPANPNHPWPPCEVMLLPYFQGKKFQLKAFTCLGWLDMEGLIDFFFVISRN